MFSGPAIGLIALACRIVGLGLERPLVKALGQGRDSITSTTLYFGLGLLFLVPPIVWQWISTPDYLSNWQGWIWPALAAGLIYMVAFHSYVWGLSIGEVSYLSPLYATAFVWLYALDLMYGEATLGLRPALGILLVTLGVVLLNVIPGRSLTAALNPLVMLRQPGAAGMLIYSFGLATARLVDNSVADFAPPLPYAFMSNLPCVLAGLLVLAVRGTTGQMWSLLKERKLIALVGAFAGIFAYVMLLTALDYYSPSVVEPVTQLSVFIAVGLGALWFKEPVRARLAASLLLVIGAALLIAR
jgi:drug/metabolite transporter (DMT)-like permease